MTRIAACLCGPRRRVPVTSMMLDAGRALRAAKSDPTGTLPIVKRWSRDLDARWSTIKRMLPHAIAERGNPVNMISHSALTGKGDPVHAFQSWLDEAMRQIVVGINGAWLLQYVRNAADLGALHARSATVGTDQHVGPSIVDRTHLLQSLAIAELQGIVEAVSQQLVRAFANGLLARQSPSAIAGQMRSAIDSVGSRRGQLLASFMAVKAFNSAALDGFRSLGVSHVGLVPERVAPAPLTRDAGKSKKGLVNVLTAEDDLVCPECEEIAADGPYPIDEAEHLIPAHVRCRCAFQPADPKEREEVLGDADFDENKHPRAPNGKWTSGAGGEITAYHGTTLKAWNKIKKTGLKVTRGRTFDKSLYKDERGRAVYVASSFKTADWYARNRSWIKGGEPVIIEMRIPKKEWENFQRDTKHEGTGAAFTTKTIPAKWIVGALGSKYTPSGGFVDAEPDYVIAYIVLDPSEWDDATTDSVTHIASGVMITADNTGRTLFVRRKSGDQAGTWAFPGGAVEPGETVEQAAARETREEIGYDPSADMEQGHRGQWNDVDFTTYLHNTEREFRPHLNHEHDAYKWALVERAPEPLHPGVAQTLDRMDAALRERDLDDAPWNEDLHPRDKNGKFSSGAMNNDAMLWSNIEQADKELSGEEAKAVDHWVGGPPDAAKNGQLFGGFFHGALEKEQGAVQKKFQPIAEELRKKYGDTIELYRYERLGEGEQPKGRTIYSYTSDPNVSEWASTAPKKRRMFTEADITKAEKEFADTGRVQITKSHWLEQQTLEANGKKIDYIAIMRGDGMVTDTPSVRDYMESINADSKENNDKRAAALKNVVVEHIPVKDIIWATDRFNQKEFIVRKRTPANDDWTESLHPRDPNGRWTVGNHPAGPLKREVRGTSAERVAGRRLLETKTDPDKIMRTKLKAIASFWKQHAALVRAGKLDKAKEIEEKIARYAARYNIPNPLAGGAPVAAATAAPARSPSSFEEKKKKISEDLPKFAELGRSFGSGGAYAASLVDRLASRDVTAEEFMRGMVAAPTSEKPNLRSVDRESISVSASFEGGGSMDRTINLATNSAYHAYFSIPRSAQGSGMGKEILRSQIALYKKIGIKKVSVNANIDVGGYAWAKYGYVPKANEWNGFLKRDLGSKIEYLKRQGRMTVAEETGLRKLFRSTDPKAFWAIADSKHGKDLLLNSGWHGELNLDDDDTMRRFDAYVNRGSR